MTAERLPPCHTGVDVEAEVATVAAPQPEPTVHTGPWTLDEWLALPEGPPYAELVDGLLVMSPEAYS